MPCFSIYSRFIEEMDTAYSLTIFFFLVTGLIGFMAKWTDFDKLAKQSNYSGNKKYPISGLFFDAWDWDNNQRGDRHDSGTALLRDLNYILNEKKIL